MASVWDITLGVFTGGLFTGGKAAVEELGKGNALSDTAGAVSDAVGVSKVIWTNLSDYRMWRSLGWLLLGIVLMILGFVVWNRRALGSVAKVAAL